MTSEESVSGEHRLLFTVVFEQEMEPDRLEEYLAASFSGERVQVRDLDEGKVIHDGF